MYHNTAIANQVQVLGIGRSSLHLWLGPEDMGDLEIESKQLQDDLLSLVARVKANRKEEGSRSGRMDIA